MSKSDESRNTWRINRHAAVTMLRIRKLAHGPLKRLRFFQQTGKSMNSLGIRSYNWLKIRLGGRKICALRYIIVVVKEKTNE